MSRISISSIENLATELFYEIFEYLTYREIYRGFLNLNSHFQQIINSSLLSLKIQFRSRTIPELIDSCRNLIIPNRHRIISLCLKNEFLINGFFTYCIMDCSFTRLQSIVLRNMNIDKSILPLFYLNSLPHLFSLTIYIDAKWDDNLNNIYRMIFSFSSLKYYKISALLSSEDVHTNIFVPLAMNEKFSTIEYLIIDHCCTLDEIFSMLVHTPRLRHLVCKNVKESQEKNRKSKGNHVIQFDIYFF